MSRVLATIFSLLLLLLTLNFIGCEGDQGVQGPEGPQGPDGEDGADASNDPPGDMYFGMAIGNNSGYNHNGKHLLRLTFNQDETPSGDVVVCYKLDKPPVIDGQDKGEDDWGSDFFSTGSTIPLNTLRGADSRIGQAEMRAGYDDEYVYFMVRWQEVRIETTLTVYPDPINYPDSTINVDSTLFNNTADWSPQRWKFSVSDLSWAQQAKDEDRLLLYWDISGVSGWSSLGSSLIYHGADSSLYLDGSGLVDVWHWKAGKTGLIGFFDDEVVSSDGLIADQGSPAFVPNYAMTETGPLPRWMHRLDPAGNDNFSPPLYLYDTTPFISLADWRDNNTILGYVAVLPLGGRSDIESSPSDAAWEAGSNYWTVEFRRPRNTGHGDDVRF